MVTFIIPFPEAPPRPETHFKAVNFPNGVTLICREPDPFSPPDSEKTRDFIFTIEEWTANTGTINDGGRMRARYCVKNRTGGFDTLYLDENGITVIAVVTPNGLVDYLEGFEEKWSKDSRYRELSPERDVSGDRFNFTDQLFISSRYGWFMRSVAIAKWSEDNTQVVLKHMDIGEETNWLDVKNLHVLDRLGRPFQP